MSNILRKIKGLWTPTEDEFEDEYDGEYEDAIEDARSSYKGRKSEERARSVYKNRKENKVVNIHATAQLQVVICRPEHFGEETRNAADELREAHTVVLNLEETESDASRRILDFLSGVAYADGGKIKRIAKNTYIITPYNVDITGEDLVDGLENNGVYF